MQIKDVRKKIRFPELSYKIMEAVFEVHNQLGPGFTENIYEAALVRELVDRRIQCEHQKSIKIRYKGKHLGTYRLDLVVDGKIILELKAMKSLERVHKQQLKSYLKASKLTLGILINFGSEKVEFHRIVN